MNETEFEQTTEPEPITMPLWWILSACALPWIMGAALLLGLLLGRGAIWWVVVLIGFPSMPVVLSFMVVFPLRFFKVMRQDGARGQRTLGSTVDLILSLFRPPPRTVRKHPWLRRFAQISAIAWWVLLAVALTANLLKN